MSDSISTPSALALSMPFCRKRDEGLEFYEAEDTLTNTPKKAPMELRRKWKHAARVLNASLRFRHTLYLKKEKEKEEFRMKIPIHAQVPQIDQQGAPQMRVAAPNSYSYCRPSNERSNLNGMFAPQYAIVALVARFASFPLWAHLNMP